jgi:hypothetical protein
VDSYPTATASMVGFFPLGLLSAASFHLVRAVPAEPADPTITPPAVLPLLPRQQDAAFIGYLSTDGSCTYSPLHALTGTNTLRVKRRLQFWLDLV